MDFYVDTEKDLSRGFPNELGMLVWNRAVQNAPEDTGNLKRSIVMSKNSPFQKQIVYNAMNALYLDYLEKGQGPVKKHKGYISQKTVGIIVVELIHFCKTGKVSELLSTPMVTMKKSKQGPMFHEKKIMKKFDVSWQTLTADDRRKMSRFKYGTKNRLTIEKDAVKGSARPKIHREYKMIERVFRER